MKKAAKTVKTVNMMKRLQVMRQPSKKILVGFDEPSEEEQAEDEVVELPVPTKAEVAEEDNRTKAKVISEVGKVAQLRREDSMMRRRRNSQFSLENRLKKKIEDKEKARSLRTIAEEENEKTVRAQELEREEARKRMQERLSARRQTSAGSSKEIASEHVVKEPPPPSLLRAASKMFSKRDLAPKEDEAPKPKPTLLARMATGLGLAPKPAAAPVKSSKNTQAKNPKAKGKAKPADKHMNLRNTNLMGAERWGGGNDEDDDDEEDDDEDDDDDDDDDDDEDDSDDSYIDDDLL
jgi:hypothetical protein